MNVDHNQSSGLATPRSWPFHQWLKLFGLRRGIHHSISDLEEGRWPSSMRLSVQGHAGIFYRNRGLIFVACVFIVFMQAGLFTGHSSHISPDVYPDVEDKKWWAATTLKSPFGKSSRKFITAHPIPKLMVDAEENFRNLLSRQSRTLQAAVTEYKRRYRRDPPKGFDDWWGFVKKHNVKIVDDYDGLVSDLAPFWEMSGEELRRRAREVGLLPSIDLVRIKNGNTTIQIVNKEYKDTDPGARAKGFRDIVAKFQSKLPDMDFPINAKAEGRVLVPWEHRRFHNVTIHANESPLNIAATLIADFQSADWQGDGNIWEAYRRTCPPTSPARRLFSSTRNVSPSYKGNFFESESTVTPGNEFTFVKQTDITFDFCSHPWAHYMQGLFFSDWRTIPVLYPVFSPAKTKGFSDIRIPSHYYYGSTSRYTYGWDAINLELKEVDDMEVPWEKKSEKVFWRGATTGGGSTPPGFSHQYQRHRFLRMASDASENNKTITFADPPTTTNFVSAKVPAHTVNSDIMDVAFVKSVGYYSQGPDALLRDHRFADAVPLGKHWSYKYLLDMDGMSYSGRFMAFLASDSAVLKATVYQEYFSDWIQPWLHFIPLSMTYKEIYNIHAFFSGTPLSALKAINSSTLHLPSSKRGSIEGDRRLRRIARAGKQWKKTIGRTVDMEAYVYRLCLEYARLCADDRDSMSFKL